MGCGQSQFSLIYPKRLKKKRRKQNRGESDSDDEDDDDESEENKSFSAGGGGRLVSNRSVSNLVSAAANEEDVQLSPPSTSRLNRLNLNDTVSNNNSPLVVHREMTTSQKEFFEMLDRRIANGADFDENLENGTSVNTGRMRQLLNDWERAKLKYLLKEQRTDSSATGPMHQFGLQSTVTTINRQPRRFQSFITPHLNGDVRLSYQHSSLYNNSIRQTGPQSMTFYCTNPGSLTTSPPFSNTVVQYDQLRGNVYTKLA